MKLAITGATGFLGSNLCRLATEAGHTVSAALGTDLHAGADLLARGLPFEKILLSDVGGMRSAFRGADVVVHCAAKSDQWGPRRAFHDANVVGTANVAEACRAARIARLVHVSSSSVYFAFRDRFAIRESEPLPPPVNEYARSKALSEVEALAFDGDVAVLRPRGIFGPGDAALVPRLARAARRGRLPAFRGGRAVVDVTFVDVVASAILAAATAPGRVRGTYNVSHGEPIPIRELVELVLGRLGMRVAWRDTPVPLALAAARVAQALRSAAPGAGEPHLTPYVVGLLAYSQTLDISAIAADLGWRPPIRLRDALALTLASMRPPP